MRSLLLLLLLTAPAAAEPPQAQADLGLSVVGLGYEHPLSTHTAIEGQAGIFGTYFLPWFGRGDDVQGLQAGGRVTWFAHPSFHGLYVAPYARALAVRGSDGTQTGSGFGFTAGAFVGYAFRLSSHVDLRTGAGAQYIYFSADPFSASTPFVALDLLLGYRL